MSSRLPDKKIFVTGASGFIGFHLCRALLAEGAQVCGIDNMNTYYDSSLKESRLRELQHPAFVFRKLDLNDPRFRTVLCEFAPHQVVHLAAQAGVRYSLENPDTYVEANVLGTLRLLETVKALGLEQLIYASSSSVYGGNQKMPFSEQDPVDHPMSLYAVTKRSTELMAATYAQLYPQSPMLGLRFFTVYGPWGRPDMAYWKFTERILRGQPIEVYNGGKMKRDFTYVSDVVESVVRLILKPGQKTHQILNIGASHPENLEDMIRILEHELGIPAQIQYLPMQPGDVYETYADVKALHERTGYRPQVSLAEGLSHFVRWFRSERGQS